MESRKKYNRGESARKVSNKSSRTQYRKKAENTNENSGDNSIRLNRYLANAGICSRREADELISAGLVSINGVVVAELGTKVKEGDDVRYNGERLRKERLVYILLNKPKDYVTTTRDPHAKRTVLDLVRNACKERVFPVGRLDRNTTGVLLITNDGELSKVLTHPSHNNGHNAHVGYCRGFCLFLGGTCAVHGFELEDGFIKADDLSYIDPNDKKEIGVEVHSGRNRVVRRMFEHLGYTVKKLDRVYFAGLTKKGLTRGRWRFLTQQEIGMLKMGSYK